MKFTSQSIEEHKDVPLADEGRLEEVLNLFDIPSSQAKLGKIASKASVNRSYVVSVRNKKSNENRDAKLDEIKGLVTAQGDEIVGHEMLAFDNVTPKTFIGTGALLTVAKKAREKGATLLVLDVQLSPSQMRNIEHLTNFSVSDRESVILNIFVKHARSRKSRIQVEIAQLKYLRPRIRGIGLNMDQQSGGIMGGRGAGETASELLARQLDKRLVQLQKLAAKLSNISVNQRKQRSQCKRISLVGYTNAGKTSLMNILAKSELSVKNQVFETLDSTTRRISDKASGDVLLSDTVGFIRDLPKHLMDSFESTLAEISETDLLVIVLDCSHAEMQLQLNTTLDVLRKLNAENIPMLYVFNKTDLLERDYDISIFKELSLGHDYVALSANDFSAVTALRHKLLLKVNDELVTASIYLKYQDQNVISRVYNSCEVLAKDYDGNGITFLIRGDKQVIQGLKADAEEMNL